MESEPESRRSRNAFPVSLPTDGLDRTDPERHAEIRGRASLKSRSGASGCASETTELGRAEQPRSVARGGGREPENVRMNRQSQPISAFAEGLEWAPIETYPACPDTTESTESGRLAFADILLRIARLGHFVELLT